MGVSEKANGNFEELLLNFVPDQEGYIMIYTSNQTADNTDVFFDDMTVLHTSGPIVRVDDYYPYGLTYNTSQLSGALTNKYLYNGKEFQDELSLNWYDYGARMYDPVLGRWHVLDPLANKAAAYSPYRYGFDNPINSIDPNGMIEVSIGIGLDRDNDAAAKVSSLSDYIESSDQFSEGKGNPGGPKRGTADNPIALYPLYIFSNPSGVVSSGGFSSPNVQYALETAYNEDYMHHRPAPGTINFDPGTQFSLGYTAVGAVKGITALVSVFTTEVDELFAETGTQALAKTGVEITEHAAQRMAQRGITEKMVQTAFENGSKFYDLKNGVINYILQGGFASGKDLLIGVSLQTSKVTTVIRGTGLVSSRFIPLP